MKIQIWKKKWEFMAGYLKSEIKGLCNEHS